MSDFLCYISFPDYWPRTSGVERVFDAMLFETTKILPIFFTCVSFFGIYLFCLFGIRVNYFRKRVERMHLVQECLHRVEILGKNRF